MNSSGWYFPNYIVDLTQIPPRGLGYIRKHPNLNGVLDDVRENIEQLQRAESCILAELETRRIRRREILSEWIFSVFNDPDTKEMVRKELDGYLTDKDDRLLFKLSPERPQITTTAIELQSKDIDPLLLENLEDGSYGQICSSDDPVCIPSEGQSAA